MREINFLTLIASNDWASFSGKSIWLMTLWYLAIWALIFAAGYFFAARALRPPLQVMQISYQQLKNQAKVSTNAAVWKQLSHHITDMNDLISADRWFVSLCVHWLCLPDVSVKWQQLQWQLGSAQDNAKLNMRLTALQPQTLTLFIAWLQQGHLWYQTKVHRIHDMSGQDHAWFQSSISGIFPLSAKVTKKISQNRISHHGV